MIELRHGIFIDRANPGRSMSGNSEEVFSNYLIELRPTAPNHNLRKHTEDDNYKSPFVDGISSNLSSI